QTGALITRLNNDVLGAQQAFTDTLSNVVSNLISVSLVIVTMLFLSWQITLVALALLPVFVVPARWVGRRLQTITRESYALNAGTVVALTAYLSRLYGPLTQLSNVNVDVMTALVSFERVFEVLDLPPSIDEKPDAAAVPRGPATIEFDHVDFSYPTAEEVSLASLESVATLERTASQQVLFDVSFTAEPGQLVALVGPSGAGKTTISHL